MRKEALIVCLLFIIVTLFCVFLVNSVSAKNSVVIVSGEPIPLNIFQTWKTKVLPPGMATNVRILNTWVFPLLVWRQRLWNVYTTALWPASHPSLPRPHTRGVQSWPVALLRAVHPWRSLSRHKNVPGKRAGCTATFAERSPSLWLYISRYP